MRRKKVSQQILLAFVKRVATLSTQVTHNGALACMGIIKTVMQASFLLHFVINPKKNVNSMFNSFTAFKTD